MSNIKSGTNTFFTRICIPLILLSWSTNCASIVQQHLSSAGGHHSPWERLDGHKSRILGSCTPAKSRWNSWWTLSAHYFIGMGVIIFISVLTALSASVDFVTKKPTHRYWQISVERVCFQPMDCPKTQSELSFQTCQNQASCSALCKTWHSVRCELQDSSGWAYSQGLCPLSCVSAAPDAPQALPAPLSSAQGWGPALLWTNAVQGGTLVTWGA